MDWVGPFAVALDVRRFAVPDSVSPRVRAIEAEKKAAEQRELFGS